MEATLDDGMSKVMVRFLFAGLEYLQAGYETVATVMTDDIWVLVLNVVQTGIQNLAHRGGIGSELLTDDFLQVGERGGAANRVASVRASHGTGRKLVHNLSAADDCRQWQRAADAFSAAD